jgi:leader peptidase (prepilin peptidase)/N-methyltransferase
MVVPITILAFVFVIGLCIGSFLNVVILRALSEESIVFPASKCPKCQTPLKWWHNIPVLSYILLGGKCAYCKEKISIQYPIIELFTGIVFTLLFLKFGFTINTLFMWAIASMMIVLAGTDIREKVVFDVHTYILTGLGLLYNIFVTVMFVIMYNSTGAQFVFNKLFLFHNPLTSAVLGMVCGVVILEVFARLGYLFAGTRAFGEGDTLIALGLGAIFGWKLLLIVLILSVIIQVIAFLPMFIKGLVTNKDWKTLTSFIGFVAYAIAFCALKLYGTAYLIGAVILAILGILSCIFILKGLKEKPENRTYMPFGPAMVLAGLIILLF